MKKEQGLSTAGADRQSQVNEKLCSLTSAISRLQDAAGSLEARLQGVLTPAPPASDSTAKEVESFVPLAEEIRVLHSRVCGTEHLLLEIIDRIEL